MLHLGWHAGTMARTSTPSASVLADRSIDSGPVRASKLRRWAGPRPRRTPRSRGQGPAGRSVAPTSRRSHRKHAIPSHPDIDARRSSSTRSVLPEPSIKKLAERSPAENLDTKSDAWYGMIRATFVLQIAAMENRCTTSPVHQPRHRPRLSDEVTTAGLDWNRLWPTRLRERRVVPGTSYQVTGGPPRRLVRLTDHGPVLNEGGSATCASVRMRHCCCSLWRARR